MLCTAVLTNIGIAPGDLGDTSEDLYDIEHKATPTFYGGIITDYNPIEKLSLNANLYYMSRQELVFQYENDIIDPKTILNLKVSYQVWKNNSLYFNARNILNQDHNEFMFMDKIGAQYLVGLNLNF